MKAVTTWIVIANGTQARILSHTGAGHPLLTVDELTAADPVSRAAKDKSDRPGRSFDSVGGGRHSMEPPTDFRTRAKSMFAETLGEHLHTHYGRHAFDRLIVVAAPAMLGNIRKALPDGLEAYGELAKDLTQTSDENVAEHLSSFLAI